MGKWELQRENSYLEDLKSNLKSVVKDLSSANDNIDLTKVKIDDNYKINADHTESYLRLKSLHDDISSEKTYIEHTVIPAIDDKIESNEKEIERIEEEERKREEERKKSSSSNRSNNSSSSSSITIRWR